MLEMKLKKKTGKIIDKFGNETTEENKSKKDSLFNNKTTTTTNKSYKPTGKFIYGNDVLNTIKEIL